MALAKYATMGADVLFVMNYPAYLNSSRSGANQSVGLGYSYGTDSLLKQTTENYGPESGNYNQQLYTAYLRLLASYDLNPMADYESEPLIDDKMKRILTDIAFHMAMKVWHETGNEEDRGCLYFCIGGYNDINPFHEEKLKNEAFVYASYCQSGRPGTSWVWSISEGSVVFEDGREFGVGVGVILDYYPEVFLDFNGSMAFLSNHQHTGWHSLLSSMRHKIKAAVVITHVSTHVSHGRV